MTALVRIAAIIPVGRLEAAKSRLGGALDAEERQDLADRMLARTVDAALAVQVDGGLQDVLVISPDRAVLARAAAGGARTLRQRTHGLNAGLVEARDDVAAGGADALIVFPIDLPFISAEAIRTVVDAVQAEPAGVIIVTDRHGTGTNVLALHPTDVISFAFGPASRTAHRAAANSAGVPYRELDSPLSVDLDTPDDLAFIDSTPPERLGVG